MSNITAPKIPEGEKVDFDVSELHDIILYDITSCVRFWANVNV